jgi:hypothetical protein
MLTLVSLRLRLRMQRRDWLAENKLVQEITTDDRGSIRGK